MTQDRIQQALDAIVKFSGSTYSRPIDALIDIGMLFDKHRDTIRTVLESALNDGWQDISTAPKDGTWVLVYGKVDDEGDTRNIAVAQYTDYLNCGKCKWHWQFAWYDGGYYGRIEDVTHWRPLPPPPQEDTP